jgi:hypothetical protein
MSASRLVGIRRTSREFPHKLQPGNRSPPAPPSRRAGPTADREGGGLWHLPWERPGPPTEASARSERAAGWEDPSPARPLDLCGHPGPGSSICADIPAAPGCDGEDWTGPLVGADAERRPARTAPGTRADPARSVDGPDRCQPESGGADQHRLPRARADDRADRGRSATVGPGRRQHPGRRELEPARHAVAAVERPDQPHDDLPDRPVRRRRRPGPGGRRDRVRPHDPHRGPCPPAGRAAHRPGDLRAAGGDRQRGHAPGPGDEPGTPRLPDDRPPAWSRTSPPATTTTSKVWRRPCWSPVPEASTRGSTS